MCVLLVIKNKMSRQKQKNRYISTAEKEMYWNGHFKGNISLSFLKHKEEILSYFIMLDLIAFILWYFTGITWY